MIKKREKRKKNTEKDISMNTNFIFFGVSKYTLQSTVAALVVSLTAKCVLSHETNLHVTQTIHKTLNYAMLNAFLSFSQLFVKFLMHVVRVILPHCNASLITSHPYVADVTSI